MEGQILMRMRPSEIGFLIERLQETYSTVHIIPLLSDY